MSAIEYALVDDQINSWLATGETEPMISSNFSDQRPHSTDCHDDKFRNLVQEFLMFANPFVAPYGSRTLVFTNVVFDCLSYYEELGQHLYGYYLETYPKLATDYVYFNNDEFRDTFTVEDLYRSLSPVFPAINSSQSHLYFVDSIDDIDNAFDDISFCADSLRSKSLTQSQKCSSKQIENLLPSFLIYYITSSIAFVLILVTMIAFIVYIRKCFRAYAIRKEFIRQIAINNQHRFDYIQTLWKVEENNVDVDYANLIGKGSQSIVYRGQFRCVILPDRNECTYLGKLKQKSPIVDIFNTVNLAHFENCAIAVKKVRPNAPDYYYEQTLNEIRICSKIGYHPNICTMLGYVSSEQTTCLLLELAQTDLLSALKTMNEQISKGKNNEIDDVIQYLRNIAIQIADGMVRMHSSVSIIK